MQTSLTRAVLLLNLGSPASPSQQDVRRYLDEFLMDGRVIDIPYPLRWILVKALILPRRPAITAEAYRQIWRAEGSPLVAISQAVQALLQEKLDEPVALGMRYGHPSLADALQSLLRQHPGLQEIQLLPLYPHYAMSSFETAVVQLEKVRDKLAPKLAVKVHPPFCEDPLYIRALVESARTYFDREYDHLLFSYHGIPERHLRKSDPTGQYCQVVPNCCEMESAAHATCYRAQVFKTTRAFVKLAGIAETKYSVAFQSRLGRTPWLTPYTDFELVRFPKEGIRRLLVICPSFVSDCLETLEEINIRGKASFLAAGGQDLTYIPCLNTHPLWIEALADWCR